MTIPLITRTDPDRAAEAATLAHVYTAMLRVPMSSPWRISNQALYASVRDRLAEITMCDAEHVQITFESLAARA